MIKVVVDTNVLLSAFLTPNPSSPNKEVLTTWREQQWIWLYSNDSLAEYVEKLRHFGIGNDLIRLFVKDLILLGQDVEIAFFHLPVYPRDPDDIAFLLCALNGSADYLISYDAHLLDLSPHYARVFITQPLDFLEALRKSL